MKQGSHLLTIFLLAVGVTRPPGARATERVLQGATREGSEAKPMD